MIDDKLPPHNPEAEEAVLGSLLIDGELIKSVYLQPGDFYYEAGGIILKAMLDLKEKGTAVDQITVAQKLSEQDKLEAVGGAAYLSYLISICPTSIDCNYYADIVRRLSVCRQMVTVGDRITAMAYEAPEDTTGVLAKADALLLKLRQNAGGTSIITPKDRVDLLYDRYTKLYQEERGIALRTGFIDLDYRLGGGLFPGDLVIVGARPKVGKTTFLQQISNNIGLDNNILFCSAEMNVESLSDRDVASEIGEPIDAIRFGGFSHEVMSKIQDDALMKLQSMKIYFMDITRTGAINTANIYQAAYELKNRHDLAMIVIDYLGLLNDSYGNNNNDRLGYITRNLKQMALALDVPILCAHQLSRAPELREDKRPKLSDLRDSGNIEQDADVVLFLYRKSYYDDTEDKVTEVLIGAQRQGDSWKRVKLVWDIEHHRYQNYARDDSESPANQKML